MKNHLSVTITGQIFSQNNFTIYGSEEGLLDLQKAITVALAEGESSFGIPSLFYTGGYSVRVMKEEKR